MSSIDIYFSHSRHPQERPTRKNWIHEEARHFARQELGIRRSFHTQDIDPRRSSAPRDTRSLHPKNVPYTRTGSAKRPAPCQSRTRHPKIVPRSRTGSKKRFGPSRHKKSASKYVPHARTGSAKKFGTTSCEFLCIQRSFHTLDLYQRRYSSPRPASFSASNDRSICRTVSKNIP